MIYYILINDINHFLEYHYTSWSLNNRLNGIGKLGKSPAFVTMLVNLVGYIHANKIVTLNSICFLAPLQNTSAYYETLIRF